MYSSTCHWHWNWKCDKKIYSKKINIWLVFFSAMHFLFVFHSAHFFSPNKKILRFYSIECYFVKENPVHEIVWNKNKTFSRKIFWTRTFFN